ncbi:hypothetical protein ACFSQE_07400 [Vogesella fluminis]|uniref:Uncharacterized protein n=1 Tax=Vogesella fluminis TaxID=1069161 RepID=A0ABQ3HDC4_9NEIS|nr:hypothetical protein [Vogesella fluminis]GHD80338.1 hypothetical protein GCM10011419_24910 [Vogesella fluminis]
MEIANKLEIHYYLANDEHSMNALVRNKCEAELLAIFKEVCATFDIDLPVETLAYREGGLKEIWKFLGENGVQIQTILAIFTLVLTIASIVLSRIPLSDVEKDQREKELAELSIEEKRLSIEEKRLAIQKLKKEMTSGEVAPETIELGAKAAAQNLKIHARKSNFYRLLDQYPKVTGIAFSQLGQDNTPVSNERFVPRADFKKHILLTNDLLVESIEGAMVEIISPVLKGGNYHWKGVYQGKPINFVMTDAEFKNSVLRKEVSFQHGSSIECVLQVSRKLDEFGEVVVTGYSVPTVIQKVDGDLKFETTQGRRYRAHRKFKEAQIDLFTAAVRAKEL